jgi:hypothetical protein
VSDLQSTLASQGRNPTHGETNTSSNITFSDPDAAFRPFVTPYYSTRPHNDCGKIGDMEG